MFQAHFGVVCLIDCLVGWYSMSYLAVHFVFQLLVYRGMKYFLQINTGI